MPRLVRSVRDRWVAIPRPAGAMPAEPLLAGTLVLLAVAVRFVGLGYVTRDMRDFTSWYHALEQHGFFAGLGYQIGNYNAPYLYLLDVATLLPFSTVTNIKLVYLVFDVVLAYYTYRVVALRRPGWRWPFLAALTVALLPTVVVNASMFGQCDAMYAAFMIGGLYHLLRDRPWVACGMLGLAYALKPQAVFIYPVLLVLAMAHRLPWRTLLAAPAVYLALDLPAVLAGRSPVELLTIYVRQATLTPELTRNAASIYQFIPSTAADHDVRQIGRLLTIALVLGVCFILAAHRERLTDSRIVLAAALFTIMVPAFLPAMHDRYFFAADVLTVIAACYRPKLWPVPILVQVASLLSTLPVLLRVPASAVIDFRILSVLILAALCTVGAALLTPSPWHPTVPAPAPAVEPFVPRPRTSTPANDGPGPPGEPQLADRRG